MGGDWKALFAAAEQKDLATVKYYIEKGIDPNYQHPEFLTAPLVECIRLGNLEVARYLLENGADPNIVELMENKTPMALALTAKNMDAVNLLKEFGADDEEVANQATKKGWLSRLFQ